MLPNKIQYSFWHGAIFNYWRNIWFWHYDRTFKFPDQYKEDINDALGCYCMGGEL